MIGKSSNSTGRGFHSKLSLYCRVVLFKCPMTYFHKPPNMVGFLSVSYPIMEDQIRENGLAGKSAIVGWFFPWKKTVFHPFPRHLWGPREPIHHWGAPQRPPQHGPKLQRAGRPDTPAPRRKPALCDAQGSCHWRTVGKSRGNYGFCHQTDQIWLNMGLSCKLMQIVPPIQWSCVLFTWKMEKHDGKRMNSPGKTKMETRFWSLGGTMVKQWCEHCEKWGGKSCFSGNVRRNLTGRPMETSKLKLLNGNLTVKKKQLDVFSLVSGRNRLAKRRSVRMDSEAYGAGQPPNMLAWCVPYKHGRMAKLFPADGRIKTIAGHKYLRLELDFHLVWTTFCPAVPTKTRKTSWITWSEKGVWFKTFIFSIHIARWGPILRHTHIQCTWLHA